MEGSAQVLTVRLQVRPRLRHARPRTTFVDVVPCAGEVLGVGRALCMEAPSLTFEQRLSMAGELTRTGRASAVTFSADVSAEVV